MCPSLLFATLRYVFSSIRALIHSIESFAIDEELADQPVQLTGVHRMCIRAIRKVKLMLARRRFREALRPYDVKDVIEQYTAGHSDLLVRMKNMASRLDTILGRQGAKEKDVYESKVSLASRIVKVERQARRVASHHVLQFDFTSDTRL